MSDLTEFRERVAEALTAHRVNYHHRNVGPEPVTADNLRYTSCEGCDWLGGHRDEAGWEAHLADALLAPGGVVAGIVAERDRLRQWKDEALPILDGLQELGRALDLPLGERITGPRAVEAAEALRAERDSAAEVRARVEALAAEWESVARESKPHLGCLDMHRHLAGELRAALADEPRPIPPARVPCTCGSQLVAPYPNDTGHHSTTECIDEATGRVIPPASSDPAERGESA